MAFLSTGESSVGSVRSNRSSRAVGALTITFALALTATACGNDSTDTTTAASDTEHNDADVAFASNMLQHHAQALAMVDVMGDRTLDPDVQKLAEQIRDGQAPEIETFADWLDDWGQDVPETVRDHANSGHDMDDMGMDGDDDVPGMMSDDAMMSLEEADEGDFQTMWLTMMIEHHEGAIEMAHDEVDDGQYQPAIDLAEEIISSQSAEIDTMNAMLD